MERLLTNEELLARRAELVGKRFPVLSHGGVTLVDFMGNDQRVVEAARTTSGIESKGEKEDRNLVRFLMRHRHGTPFEFPEVDLLLEIPMDAWRQFVRHRMASINEFSSRYSEVPDLNDVTAPDQWRLQSTANRQGSSGNTVNDWPEGCDGDEYYAPRMEQMSAGEYLSAEEAKLHQHQRAVYEERLRFGVAKEVARKDLCLSTYTRVRWKSELRNVFHMLGLRMDPHAQLEIRQFANAIGNIISQIFPVCWQAFLDYELNALTLSALDIQVIQNLQASQYIRPSAIPEGALERSVIHGEKQLYKVQPHPVEAFMLAQHPDWKGLEKCREREECLTKLRRLGLVAA